MNVSRSHRIILLILCLSLVNPLFVVVADAQYGSLTRGSGFTVTITGNPRTPYYVWIARTSFMSGAPGDQPPIISGGIVDIEKDPPEGPYVIGMHTVSSGGTIIDDVSPSPDGLPGTNYYALVTTNADGLAVVQFRTSSSTAARTYSIKVEDRTGTAVNFQVGANLFPRITPPLPVITTIPVTTRITTTPPVTTPELPALTTVPAQPVTLPSKTPEPAASMPRSASVSAWTAWGAVAVVLVFAAKRQENVR